MCASPAASIFPHVPMRALSARCAFAVSQHQLARGTVRASSDMSRRLIPLLDRVLVQKVAAPEKSIGGVLLPETASKVCILHRRPEESGSAKRVTSKSTTCTCWSLAVTEEDLDACNDRHLGAASSSCSVAMHASLYEVFRCRSDKHT